MHSTIKPFLLAVFFGIGGFGGAALADDKKTSVETSAQSFETQVDELIAKHEAFQIGVKDDKDFRKNWITRLRLVAITKPKTAATPNFVMSIGSEMMLDGINPYLRRADDDSAIAFMQILVKIFDAGIKDEVICKAFLDSSDNVDVSDSDNERIESLLGPLFYNEMIVAVGTVMRAGTSGPENVLSESENKRVIVEMLGVMAKTYGNDSVDRMQTLEDKKVPAPEKCNTMTQMLNSIAKLKKQDQAGLIRTIFSGDGK